jgi:PAS domain S-box-containing protein
VYVDADGRPLDPADRPDRAVTIVERSGKRVAALIHDPALTDNTELLETVGGTAGLALENEQLQADLRARLGALEQSERRFRELLENVHLIAVSLDLDGRITFCNQYLADLAGYSRADLIGRPWAETFNPADERFVAQVREGSINPHEEMFILTRSGERREIAWNNTLLRDDAGRLIGSTSIGEDVTERNRATRRLLLQVQVARALAGSPSMDVARPLVLEHLTRALACWVGVFWRPEPDGAALTVDGVFLTDPEGGAAFRPQCAARLLRQPRPSLEDSPPGSPTWLTTCRSAPHGARRPRGTPRSDPRARSSSSCSLVRRPDGPGFRDPEVLESTFRTSFSSPSGAKPRRPSADSAEQPPAPRRHADRPGRRA